MKKLNVCAVLALLATLTLSNAHARTQRLESHVGKRILPHEVLHVKQELGLRQYQGIGKQLMSVTVIASSQRRGASATLYINQQAVSRAQAISPGQRRSAVRFVLPRSPRITQDMKTVQVKFSGPVQVESVRAEIADAPRAPRPRPSQSIKKQVYRFQAGFSEKVSLKDLMGLQARQLDKKLKSVTIKVRSLVGTAQVSLCRDSGACPDQKSVREGSDRVIKLEPKASPRLGKMTLKTSGMVFISEVTIVLE